MPENLLKNCHELVLGNIEHNLSGLRCLSCQWQLYCILIKIRVSEICWWPRVPRRKLNIAWQAELEGDQ